VLLQNWLGDEQAAVNFKCKDRPPSDIVGYFPRKIQSYLLGQKTKLSWQT
jgi:hypothetical protein